MDKQMIIISVVFLALFIIPYILIKHFSIKKKQKVRNAIKKLVELSHSELSSIIEVTEWAFYLDTKARKLAVVNKKDLDGSGMLVDVSKLKNCSITSETDAGNIVLLDLVLNYNDADTAANRFTFYKFSADAHSEARDLKHKAEGLQAQIKSCM